MVTVRRKEREVTARALPSARFSPSATADSFGAGRARDVQRLGSALTQVASSAVTSELKKQRRDKSRADRAVAGEQLNAARNEMRTQMLAISGQKGKDALDLIGNEQSGVTADFAAMRSTSLLYALTPPTATFAAAIPAVTPPCAAAPAPIVTAAPGILPLSACVRNSSIFRAPRSVT